jgi:UDP-N-acetyl-2-amino-2-deoxyglucuronate dehydrogenase
VAAKHADAIHLVEGASIAAVCDIRQDRAASLGARLQAPAFTSLDEMLQRVPKIDAVSVLTPSGYHTEHAICAARYRKHVLVEKPMSLGLDDADAMIAACERAGVRLFVVKQSRYNAPIRRLRAAVEAGRFGKLALGTVRVRRCRRQDYYTQSEWRGTRSLDGGVIANQGSHLIDLLTWMLGDVRSVYAKTARQLVDIETEDTAAVVLQFANGALGLIEVTTAARPADLEASISILGERGSVVIAGQAADEVSSWRFDEQTANDDEPACSSSRDGHAGVITNVVRALRGEPAEVVDGVEGRRSLEVIAAIYESARTGREVVMQGRTSASLVRVV